MRRRTLVRGLALAALATLSIPAAGEEAKPASQRREVADLLRAARAAREAPSGTVAPASALLDPGDAVASLPAPVQSGLAWLEASQAADGSWGSVLPLTVTSAALETLASVDVCSAAVEPGAAWLAAQIPANYEFLARQIVGLSGLAEREEQAASLAALLLDARNPAVTNTALPNWPEGGWGIAEGYETDCMTTAVALLALDRTGYNGGFSVTNRPVAGGATNVHAWLVPADAVKVRIVITVAGSTVRLRMEEGVPPDRYDPYFNLAVGGPYLIVFPDSGLPFEPGTNYITIESPKPPALPASYTMTVSYETPTYDTRTLAEPLAYLREAQNLDGGWGLQRGGDTELYTTIHVLLSLLRYSNYDLSDEIASAVAWLKAEQLADGSFGYGDLPVPYVTALATLALVRAETPTFGPDTEDAIAALLAAQQLDGSWDQEAYDTSLALLALWEHGLPPTANAGPDQAVTDADGDCLEAVTLAGSGTPADGVITGFSWSHRCAPLATGSAPTVLLPIGTHRILLTVEDDSGLTGTDTVEIVVAPSGATFCADEDGDGILEDGDGSGLPDDFPCPDGLTVSCDDNCPGVANPDQTDADADHFGALCDCDDDAASAWAQVGEVGPLSVSHSVATGLTQISWSAVEPGGSVPAVYDTLSSPVVGDFEIAAACLESDGADMASTDGAPVPSGTVRFYLVRADNACPGAGSLGADSEGVERSGRDCP